jgi:hypothetical protein
MSYYYELNEDNKVLKEYEEDEFGNVDITYIDEEIKDIKPFNLFRNVLCSYELELKINKELYDKGNISKELYEKVENILLERIKPIAEIIKV